MSTCNMFFYWLAFLLLMNAYSLADSVLSVKVINQYNSPIAIPGTITYILCQIDPRYSPVNFLWISPVGASITSDTRNETSSLISVTPTVESGYGTYVCVANFEHQEFNASVTLTYAPQILNKPQNQFAVSSNGNNPTFTCETLAIIQLSVNWLYINDDGHTFVISPNNKYIINEYNDFVNNQEVRFSQLMLRSVTYEDHGSYNCSATNEFGSDSATANLTIQLIPSFVGSGILSSESIQINQTAVFYCGARGFPVPSTSWNQDGVTLLNKDRNIINLDVSLGNITKETSNIIQKYNLDFSSFNSADPLVIVGVLIFPKITRQTNGYFSCIASNYLPETKNISVESNSVQFMVLEPPDPPGHVALFSSGPTALSLSWISSYDGNSPVLKFNIYKQNMNVSANFMLLSTISMDQLMPSQDGTFSTTIDNGGLIIPFTQYSVKVEGCNVIGCGYQSQKSNAIITDQYLSTPPRNFLLAETTNTTITMKWTVPIPSNGIISHYMVSYFGSKYYDSDFNGDGTENFDDLNAVSVDGDQWVAKLENLTPATLYKISIAAVNGAKENSGVGIESDPKSSTTLVSPPPVPSDPPLLLFNLPNFGPQTVGIQIPTFSEINGLIRDYQMIVVLILKNDRKENISHPDILFPSDDYLDIYKDNICKDNTGKRRGYIAAKFNRNRFPPDNIFIVGNDNSSYQNSPNDYSKYTNGPLCDNVPYIFFIRAYVELEDDTTGRTILLFTSSDYTDLYIKKVTPTDPPQPPTNPPPPNPPPRPHNDSVNEQIALSSVTFITLICYLILYLQL